MKGQKRLLPLNARVGSLVGHAMFSARELGEKQWRWSCGENGESENWRWIFLSFFPGFSLQRLGCRMMQMSEYAPYPVPVYDNHRCLCRYTEAIQSNYTACSIQYPTTAA